MAKQIVYVAGPMTGLRDFNRVSFNYAAARLRELGYEVRNPACLDVDWSQYQHYIEVSLVMLRQCDCILYLPGSEKSRGVAIEKVEADGHALADITDKVLNANPSVRRKLWQLYREVSV